MTVADQRMTNLTLGDQKRVEGSRQRKALIGQPMRVVVPALIDPTPELAAMKLSTLFAAKCPPRTGPIPKLSTVGLDRAFLDLIDRYPKGRQWWHSGMKLRELTELERRRLVNALVRQAPAAWRTAAASDPKGAGE